MTNKMLMLVEFDDLILFEELTICEFKIWIMRNLRMDRGITEIQGISQPDS